MFQSNPIMACPSDSSHAGRFEPRGAYSDDLDLEEATWPEPSLDLDLLPDTWSKPAGRGKNDTRPLVRGTIWDGRYRIERTLGEGGMGSVLLAADLAHAGRAVALKVLRPFFREVATPNFLLEYSIQRLLRHPGIPRALNLGFDRHDGTEVPYFTMPFIAGEPLTTIIDERPPLSSVWRWTIEVLEALDAIHRAGYLHRDIKPGNVLVDRRAEAGPQARLIDFGITTPLTSEPEHYFTGTPAYCSPESIEGSPHDARSDLYALGLVLFELIEGRPPWASTDIDELLALRRLGRAPAVSHRQCPEAMRTLVAELLESEAERRPASAAQVIERMKAILALPEGLGSSVAFRERLAGLPLPVPSYVRALEAEGEVVLLHMPDGHDGGLLLDEIGDRGALRGVRVVHVRLEGRAGPALHELEGALDVFRRLRAEEGLSELYRGLAGAATLLTRLHRRTMLIIEGLELADEAILTVLRHAFLGAQNAFLTVVASVSQRSAPMETRAAAALRMLEEESFVTHLTLDHLTRDETHAYVWSALGAGVPATEVIDGLYVASGGRPVRLRELLAEAFDRGTLVRRAAGYQWLGATAAATPRDDQGLMRERLSLLHSPFPIEAVTRYVGGQRNYQQLVKAGVLAETETVAVCVGRAECSKLYAALAPDRRHALHRVMAEALARLPAYLEPDAYCAEQLLLAGRPAAAAPRFLALAGEASARGDAARATELLAKAVALVRADRQDDAQLTGWKLEVFAAALAEARTLHDGERVLDAADDLLTAAIEVRNMPAIELALRARLDEAQETWDVASATSAVDDLLRWQRRCKVPETIALRAWSEGLELALQGNIEEVVRVTDRALAALDTTPDAAATPLTRWARSKLLALQAEVAVRGGVARVALRALDLYEAATLAARDPAPQSLVKLALWRSLWLRRAGDLTRARALLVPYELPVPAQPSEAAGATRRQEGGHGSGRLRRAAIDLALGECDLALGRCDAALGHAQRALAGAQRERDVVIAFAAEALLADVSARTGDPKPQLARLQRLVTAPPLQILPQLVTEVKLRWLGVRLELGESDALIADAIAVTREAMRTKDAGAVGRAAFIAARAELRAERPLEALRHADWVRAIDRQQPIGGPPRHAIEWLLASAHYQLKWFKSASQLSGRALESLRSIAQSHVGNDDREQWLRAGDSVLIGMHR